jgi:rod shape-determining protein MreD
VTPLRQAGEFRRVVSGVIPTLSAVIVVIMGVAPTGVTGVGPLTPFFTVAVIFFWVLARPSLMPPASVFTIGFLQDILSGGPIGLWALTLLVVEFFSISERKLMFGQSYLINWLGFAPIVLIAVITVWTGACIFYGVLLSPVPVLVQGLLTALLYPIISWILIATLRWVPAKE